MKASLVLCVKNAGSQLSQCLASLMRLDGPPNLEIILVDNGSTDAITPDALTTFARESPFQCQVLHCQRPGNGAGRNCAIAKASGDILLFIDGDCYVDPGFATDWLDVFTRNDIGFASGRILMADPAQSMVGCKVDANQELTTPGNFIHRGFIQGSNMAFRRSAIEKVGPFDEWFGAGAQFSGEEWELALRMSFAGLGGGYFPVPTVTHDHGRFDRDIMERMLFYDYGAGGVYAKHLFSRHARKVSHKILGEVRYIHEWSRIFMLFKGLGDYFRLRRP